MEEGKLAIVPAYGRPYDVKALFTEYTEMLIEGDPAFREYLSIQNYDREVAHLEEKYGPPEGRLYLALWDGALAGCIGMKRIDDERAEMKRLYVRPAYRGKKIGDALIERILADAKAAGYQRMLLDTLPFLGAALHLYRRHGFYEVPCYNDSPMNTSVFMERRLG